MRKAPVPAWNTGFNTETNDHFVLAVTGSKQRPVGQTNQSLVNNKGKTSNEMLIIVRYSKLTQSPFSEIGNFPRACKQCSTVH